ncbi:MAG: M20/M25/M40 family metallo-hydrolase [Bacteroidales bacterium]|nr:M20/M25/M40 family metallo-hydrolase [Bacteroidales bacterium]
MFSQLKFHSLLVGILLAVSGMQAQKNASRPILPGEVSKHVYTLASDGLLGRKTAGSGIDSAAWYISTQFKCYGLQTVNGSYFQEIGLVQASLGDTNEFSVITPDDTLVLKIKTDFVPFEISGNMPAHAPVVFAGYGITAPEYGYNDYSTIDAQDKIVLILHHEPGECDSNSVFNGARNTKHSLVKSKVDNAIAHGAVGVIIVTDPLNHKLLNPVGFPWPNLSKIIPDDALPIKLSGGLVYDIPVIHAGKSVINLFFGGTDSLLALQKSIDNTLAPASFAFGNLQAKIKTTTLRVPLPARNVVGFLPGKNPKMKNELIVVGAHYDHLGYIKNSSDIDSVFNGADDNASGTAAMLSIARAFSENRKKPSRSVLFIAFTAEELGLYGSQWYVNNPLFPLENTVAMLNFDMVGRNHPDSLFLVGASESPDITALIRKLNKKNKHGLILTDGKFSGGSDHAPFYNKNIPFMFFFSGLHADYHTTADNPALVDFEKVARVAALGHSTAWFIANDKKKYSLNK